MVHVSYKENTMSDKPKLLEKAAFDKTIDGKQVSLYTLDAGKGLIVQVTNFGLHVVAMWSRDKHGKYADVALGYKDIDSYTNGKNDRYIGSVVGRYANRIAKGKYTLDGKEYHAPINNNGQSLHGGLEGFDLKVWDVVKVSDTSIEFAYVSKDGEEGFPGDLSMRVTYSLTNDNGLKITYHATCDRPTIVNLTNHTFFNLKGEGNGTITDHELMVVANHFTPMSDVQIPTGEILKVENTPFDFRKFEVIGTRIDANDTQIKYGAGYDHNWVLDKKEADDLVHAITLREKSTGRTLEVHTDQPGIQVYTGNFLNGTCTGKAGKPYGRREGMAMETQKFPDSPNRSYFPSAKLNVGETYKHICIYKLGIE